MKISAHVSNTARQHRASVQTAGQSRPLPIPAKATGRGSAVNGGELLMLALATCYCNDIFREAERIGIPVDAVEVRAEADFEGIGLAASNIRYTARIDSPASAAQIDDLLRQTDAVAEIQNTVRAGVAVALTSWTDPPLTSPPR